MAILFETYAVLNSLFDLSCLLSQQAAEQCIASATAEAKSSENGLAIAVIEGESGVGKSHLLANTICEFDLRCTGRFSDQNDLQAGFLNCIETLAIELADELNDFDWAADADLLKRYFPQFFLTTQIPSHAATTRSYTALEASQRFHSLLARMCGAIFQRRTALLVLDDLQWAASSTVELLSSLINRQIASDDRWAGTVLAFSCRTPRSNSIEQWLINTSGSIPVFQAKLENLTPDDLERATKPEVPARLRETLTSNLIEATQGNLLLIDRYTRWLSNQLLNFSDASSLSAAEIDRWRNLQADLAQTPLESIPEVLAACSCFINRFKADDVSHLVGYTAKKEIRFAVESGWLSEFAGGELDFAHDQLRDAARAQLSDAQQHQFALSIAEMLLEKKKPLAALLYARNARLQAADSDLESWIATFIAGADFANTLGAPLIALNYCDRAIELCEQAAQTSNALPSVTMHRANALVLLRQHEQLAQLLQELPDDTADSNLEAWASIHSNCLVSLLGQGKLEECVDLAVAAASYLDVEFPVRGSVHESLDVIEAASKQLELPASGSPLSREVAQLLSLAIPAFHQCRPDLYPYAAAAIVRMSLGATPADTLPFGVAVLGISYALLGDREKGHRYGKRALALADNLQSRTSARTKFAVAFLLDHIVESPTSRAINQLSATTEEATRIGDVDHACYARHLSDVYGFFSSSNLHKLSSRLASGSKMINYFGQTHILRWHQVYHQLVENLRCAESPSILLHGAIFSELLADRTAPYLQYRIHLARLILSVIYQRHGISIEESAVLQNLAESAGSQYELVPFRFFAAIAHFRACLEVGQAKKAELLQKGSFHFDEFCGLTQYRAPPAELKMQILRGARLAASGQTEQAIALLEEAISRARPVNRLLEGAVAAEFMASLAGGEQKSWALAQAIDIYRIWGADTKVQSLEQNRESQQSYSNDNELLSRLVSASTVQSLVLELQQWVKSLVAADEVSIRFEGTWRELGSPDLGSIPLSVRREAARFDDVFDACDITQIGPFHGDTQLVASGTKAFISIPLRQSTQLVGIVYAAWRRPREPFDLALRTRLEQVCKLVVKLIDGKLLHLAMEQRVQENSVALLQSQESLRDAKSEVRRLEQASWTSFVVGGLSHELSSPLATARVTAGTMEEALENDSSDINSRMEVFREAMPLLWQSLETMAERINNANTKVSDGVYLDRATFSLRTMVESLVNTLSLGRTTRSHCKTTIYIPEDIVIDGYVSLTKQVLENVIRNAIEHGAASAQQGGAVEVRAERKATWVQITVSDNGNSGVELSKLFEPFNRQKASNDGIGLGLNIAQSIASGPLGGTIRAERHASTGTSIIVEIPVSAPSLPAGGVQ